MLRLAPALFLCAFALPLRAEALTDVQVLARALTAAYDELQHLPAAEPQSAHVRRPAARRKESRQVPTAPKARTP